MRLRNNILFIIFYIFIVIPIVFLYYGRMNSDINEGFIGRLKKKKKNDDKIEVLLDYNKDNKYVFKHGKNEYTIYVKDEDLIRMISDTKDNGRPDFRARNGGEYELNYGGNIYKYENGPFRVKGDNEEYIIGDDGIVSSDSNVGKIGEINKNGKIIFNGENDYIIPIMYGVILRLEIDKSDKKDYDEEG